MVWLPFLPIGWLAAIVEAHFRPPMTEDFKTIMKAETMSDLMKNKFFHIILVASLAEVGSMLGTFIAIPFMIHYLGISNPLELLNTAVENGLHLARNIL